MKEAFAAALAGFQSLAANDSREMPVDRLGALAYCQRLDAPEQSALASLGVDLIALKYAQREASKEPAAAKLAGVLCWERNRLFLTYRKGLKISRWAIGEWIQEQCITCRGAKEVPAGENIEGAQRMKICPSCSGSGLTKWTDMERTEALGAPHGRPLGVAHGYIGYAVSEAVRGAKQMLERWT